MLEEHIVYKPRLLDRNVVGNEHFSMHKGNIVLRIDQKYNMNIDKTSVK